MSHCARNAGITPMVNTRPLQNLLFVLSKTFRFTSILHAEKLYLKNYSFSGSHNVFLFILLHAYNLLGDFAIQ